MARRESNVHKEIARLRRLVDSEIRSGRIDPYQLALFYDFVISGKIALRPAHGMESLLALHQVGLGFLSIPLDKLGLGARAEHALETWDVENLGQLIQVPRQGLEATRNCGNKTIEEIEAMLAEKGLHLGMKMEERVAEAIGRPTAPEGFSLDDY